MKKYLFVINPVSGGTDKSDLIEDIRRQFNDEDAYLSIFQTSGNNDLKKLHQEINQFKPDTLVVAGGDGTINELTRVFMDYDLQIGLIPSGSANGLSTELGIDLDNAMDVIKKGNYRLLDVVRVNDRLMLHMADIGLNATLVKRYEEEDRRGFIGYTISALKELPAMDEIFEVKIHLEEETIEAETKFLVIANTRMYGTGYEINPRAQLDDQQVEICVMKALSSELIATQIFESKPLSDNKLFNIYTVSKCKVEVNKPVNFQSDGEYLGTTDQLDIEVLPNQLKILSP